MGYFHGTTDLKMCTANIHLQVSSWLIDTAVAVLLPAATGTRRLLVEPPGSLILWHLHVTHRPVWADPAIFCTLQPWHVLCTQQARLAILSSAILSVRCSLKEMSLYFQYHFSFVFCGIFLENTGQHCGTKKCIWDFTSVCVDHHTEEKNPILYTSWLCLLPGLCLLHTATAVFFWCLRFFLSESRSAGKIKVRFWTSVLKWKFNIQFKGLLCGRTALCKPQNFSWRKEIGQWWS